LTGVLRREGWQGGGTVLGVAVWKEGKRVWVGGAKIITLLGGEEV